MTTATQRIRNRRTNERRMRVAGEWALVTGAGLGVVLLAVFAVAITAARYHTGM